MRASLRTIGVAATFVLVSLVASSCASTPTATPGSIAVQAGTDARLTADDGALVVEIPGKAIEGSGTLTIKRIDAAGPADAWNIQLSGGAVLVGTATIRFKHDFQNGEPAPLIASTQDGETFEPAEAVAVSANYAEVQTARFSDWFALWWNDLLDNARRGLDAIYEGAGKQPTCTREQEARDLGYSVSSDQGNSVFWCLGLGRDDEPQLRVTNGRGYTVADESTPGLTPASGPSDLINVIANALRERPSKEGNTVTLAGPGETVDYAVTGQGDMGVRVRPSVPGYLVTAAQYAIDTLSYVFLLGGKGVPSQKVLRGLIDWESCLAGYSGMAATVVETAGQAGNYLNDAVGTTIGCLDDAITKAGLGFAGTIVAQGISWLAAGLRTALNGFGAAADTALNPSGYTILITAPTPPEPDLSSELRRRWCTRSSPQSCWDVTEPEFTDPVFYPGEPSSKVPGAIDITICLSASGEEPDGQCMFAWSVFLRYFPAGVAWNCVEIEVVQQGWPGCEPDYTSAHDTSVPRLVLLPKHQQNDWYYDSEPMYRVAG